MMLPMYRQMVRTVRALVLVATLLLGVVVFDTPGFACSCATPQNVGELRAWVAEFEGAFVGTTISHSLEEPEGASVAHTTFDVERVVKGPFGPTAFVRSRMLSCGFWAEDGTRMGLFLDRSSDGVWEASVCGQVEPSLLLAVGGGHPPDPSVEPIGPAPSSSTWPWVVGIGGVLLVVSTVMFARWGTRPSPS